MVLAIALTNALGLLDVGVVEEVLLCLLALRSGHLGCQRCQQADLASRMAACGRIGSVPTPSTAGRRRAHRLPPSTRMLRGHSLWSDYGVGEARDGVEDREEWAARSNRERGNE